MKRPWTHWVVSDDLIGLRLPAHDAGTGLVGPPMGRSVHGFDFAFDPFDAYRANLVSNPNMIVAGSIGAGKSTIVKMLLDRGLRRGRRVVVIDPKGEYGSLAIRHGVVPVALGRDGWCDPFGDDDRANRELLRALVASAQGAPLSNDQHFAIDAAWNVLQAPRPTRVLRALYEQLAPTLAREEGSASRALALVLHRFIHGDLAGLFDGARAALELRDDFIVLDLSAQWSASSLPVAALSAVAAAQRIAGAHGALGYLVLDEAWALLGDPHALRWLQGSWKLARARGLSHVMVLHRWSDVSSAGDAGSAQRERARGLLRECETVWLLRQPPDEAREMARALSMSPLEQRYLEHLPKGHALVRYGAHRSVVRITPDRDDYSFIDTDAAMRES